MQKAKMGCFKPRSYGFKPCLLPPDRRSEDATLYLRRVISNLDYKVSDEDVKELFEAFGSIKRTGVIYDRRWAPVLVTAATQQTLAVAGKRARLSCLTLATAVLPRPPLSLHCSGQSGDAAEPSALLTLFSPYTAVAGQRRPQRWCS